MLNWNKYGENSHQIPDKSTIRKSLFTITRKITKTSIMRWTFDLRHHMKKGEVVVSYPNTKQANIFPYMSNFFSYLGHICKPTSHFPAVPRTLPTSHGLQSSTENRIIQIPTQGKESRVFASQICKHNWCGDVSIKNLNREPKEGVQDGFFSRSTFVHWRN